MFIQTSEVGPVRWLTVRNPGRRNAIPPEGWGALTAEFDAFESSTQRVLVLTGEGEDFCSGADLGNEETPSVDRMQQVGAAARALHRISKPTIAAVHGVAAGAGMNLALGCDLVLATSAARFAQIFVRRGLSVDFGGTWLLPRLVGLARAKELALSGRIVGATEALAMGLVLDVVDPDELVEAAQSLAESMCDGAPIPQMLVKRSLDRSFELSFAEALAEETQAQLVCFKTEDFREGVEAFLEKRSPDFKGR